MRESKVRNCWNNKCKFNSGRHGMPEYQCEKEEVDIDGCDDEENIEQH